MARNGRQIAVSDKCGNGTGDTIQKDDNNTTVVFDNVPSMALIAAVLEPVYQQTVGSFSLWPPAMEYI